jgi:hypothetical protein
LGHVFLFAIFKPFIGVPTQACVNEQNRLPDNRLDFCGQSFWQVLVCLVGKVSFFGKVGFSIGSGFRLASVLVGCAFCQS